MTKSVIGGVRLCLYQPWMLPWPMALPILLLPLQHLEVSSKDRISKSPLIHRFTPLMINGRIPRLTRSSCEDLEMDALELSTCLKTWLRIRQLTRLRWTYSSRMVMQSALLSTYVGRSNINRPLSVATSEWARLGNDLLWWGVGTLLTSPSDSPFSSVSWIQDEQERGANYYCTTCCNKVLNQRKRWAQWNLA